MVLGRAEGRFRVGAVLPIGVPIDLVEERNQPVGGVEGSLRRRLDLASDFGRAERREGSSSDRARARREGVNVAHRISPGP